MRRDVTTPHSRGWVTRAALAALALIGAFLIVLPLATGLPGKSAASGEMMTAFRPQMTDTALAQGRADQQTMSAMAQQLSNGMLPALAAQLGMTPQQLSAYRPHPRHRRTVAPPRAPARMGTNSHRVHLHRTPPCHSLATWLRLPGLMSV